MTSSGPGWGAGGGGGSWGGWESKIRWHALPCGRASSQAVKALRSGDRIFLAQAVGASKGVGGGDIFGAENAGSVIHRVLCRSAGAAHVGIASRDLGQKAKQQVSHAGHVVIDDDGS